MGTLNRVLSLILLTLSFSEASRILGIFPTPSISHQVVFHRLVKDLAARGHKLTIITPDPIPANPNVTQIDLRETYEIKRNEFDNVKDQFDSPIETVRGLSEVLLKVMDKVLTHPDVAKLTLNATRRKFDLVIFEYLPHFLVSAAFGTIFKCPVIGITSFEATNSVHSDLGNDANVAIHPAMFLGYEHGDLSIVERFKSVVFEYKYSNTIDPVINHRTNVMIREHFPNITAYSNTLKSQVDLLLINTSPALGFVRPLVPNTVQLGFMHIEPPKPLPNGDLKNFLDNSKHGVIYMSLGSNVLSKDLGREKIAALVDAFKSSVYDIVWKFEKDVLPNKPENVFIGKWFPQADLLAHPNVKLFITQGGQQSVEEAVDRGVPMVVWPFFADQKMNAKMIERKGIGKELNTQFFYGVFIERAITDAMSPKIKQNIMELREVINDQPMTSRERAVWWCEHVIRHKGTDHLKYPGRSVSFLQKYCLDFGLYAFILFLIARKFVPKILRLVSFILCLLGRPIKTMMKNQWKIYRRGKTETPTVEKNKEKVVKEEVKEKVEKEKVKTAKENKKEKIAKEDGKEKAVKSKKNKKE